MKKLLLVLAIGSFAACNNNANSTENAIDSTKNEAVDSIKNQADSTKDAVDSTKSAAVDSVKAQADTLKSSMKKK